ncbi:Uncharacterised protein [Yersinia similis]|uniref:Uncharacterized protein n=1 Tax=Yersinia similis TaxID=367190 RepID=A0A0T9RSI0_9GAMM|nr:Uncharacterised protein [Yersinia similis]CNI81471.1 Uncharacterised protein [Yersinia similis]
MQLKQQIVFLVKTGIADVADKNGIWNTAQ